MGAEFGFHTEGRRQPMLIGKDAAGKKLWGGPYSVWQLLGLLVVTPITWTTQGVWGADWTVVGRLLATVAVAAGTVFGIGQINFAGRNPILVAVGFVAGVFRTWTAPAGRLGTKPVVAPRVRRRARVAYPRHTLVRIPSAPRMLALEAGPTTTGEPDSPRPAPEGPSTAPADKPVVTGEVVTEATHGFTDLFCGAGGSSTSLKDAGHIAPIEKPAAEEPAAEEPAAEEPATEVRQSPLEAFIAAAGRKD